MQNTTADYKIEINKPSRSFECKITIGNNIYTNEDLVDLILEYTQPQDGFSIGNTISQSLELTLLNRGDVIYSTSQIKVELGLKVGSTIEYMLMGIFNIDDIEKTDYTTKFTCYDNMIKFETAYFSSLGDKPTLQQVVNELSSKTGVQFTGSLPAYTVSKLEGFTCRETLSYVASICGGNAFITRDGKFTIKSLGEVEKSIDGNNYFEYIREEVKYKVGQISCQVDENKILSKGSIGTDSMELGFENPWVNETILTEIYNKLNGLSYLGYSMKWQGDISLDPYDIITVTDVKNVVRKIPILSQKLTYTGGLTSEIGAKGETKNKNSFSSSGSTTNKVNRLVTEQAIIKEALIEKANIKDLEVSNAKIENLEAKTAKIEEAIIDVAHIEDLNAINANIEKLIAADATINNALIGKADITELNAVKGTINVLESDTANIKNLIAGNITGESGQLIHLTASNVVIADAVIKDLIAANISVEDLKASRISTNKFTISSDDGGIEIVGATQQFKDKNNKVRIQMGQDTQGNFNFILRGEDGTTTLIDHTGIKEKAIADDLIKENMIATDAIGEKQINYSSLITGLNKDTNTSLIKASKVAMDLTGQTLDVVFNFLESNINGLDEKIKSNTTSISVAQGKIEGLISENTIIKGDVTTINDKYISLKATVDGINTTVSNHTSSIGSISTDLATANALADSKAKVFTSTPTTPYKVGDLWVQGTSGEIMRCKSARASGYYVASDWEKASKYTDDTKANAVEGNLNTLSGKVTTVENNYSSLSQNLEGFKTTVGNTYSTKSELSTVDGKVSSLTSRVSTAESSITQLNNQIALKVEATDITSAINNIQVGGRNLLRNSNNFIMTTFWFDNGGGFVPIIEDNAIKGRRSIKHEFTNIESGTQYVITALIKTDDITITVGNVYPLHIHVLCNENTGLVNYNSANCEIVNGTFIQNEYIKYKLSFRTNANISNVRLRFMVHSPSLNTSNAYIWIKEVKVEKGNKATDWTPAPEDVESSIDTAKTSAISTAAGDATNKANAAQTNAINSSKSYTDGQITTVNKTITDKVAEIKATTDSITSRVSSTESTITTINGNVTSLQRRMTSAEQKITPTAIIATISEQLSGDGKIETNIMQFDKTGLNINHSASNSSSQLNSEGLQVIDKSKNSVTAWFGKDSTAFIDTLNANNVYADNLPMLSTAINKKIYVTSGGAGDMSGSSLANAMGSIQAAINYIKNNRNTPTYIDGTYEIIVAAGYYHEDIQIDSIHALNTTTERAMLNIYFSHIDVEIYGGIKVTNCTATVQIYGVGYGAIRSSLAGIKYGECSGRTSLIYIENCNVVLIKGIDLIGSSKTSGGKGSIGVYSICTPYVYVQVLDFYNLHEGLRLAHSTAFCHACRGSSLNYSYVVDSGSICYMNTYRPNITTGKSMGYFVNCDTVNTMNSKFEAVPPVTTKTITQTFTATQYYSTRSYTEHNVLIQGAWDDGYSYGWWKGYAEFGNQIKNFCIGGSGTTMRIYLERLNTSHGYSSASNVYLNGNNIGTLKRGEGKWFTVPSTVATTLINGGKIELYYAGTTHYIKYNTNVKIEVKTTKTV